MRDHRGRMVVGFTTTMQSLPITTKVASSNQAHGKYISVVSSFEEKKNPESIIAIENQNRIKLSLEFQGGK